MDEFDQAIHHAWVQYLVASNERKAASIAIDSAVAIHYRGNDDGYYWIDKLLIDFPVPTFIYVRGEAGLSEILVNSLRTVIDGQYHPQCNMHLDGFNINGNDIQFRVLLTEPSDGWKNIVRKIIAAPSDSNQGVVTEKVFARRDKSPYTYNEMKFGSQTEILIALELEKRKVLFFPLPLAVRAETGEFYKDHREPDFLVCQNGVWGILEVSHHENRYEQDAEKTSWFKQSGILCVEHYTAERCYKEAGKVVDEFLRNLARYSK